MADFIPKPYKKEPVTIRLSSDKIEEIDRLADVCHISRSALINQCIDYALEHVPMFVLTNSGNKSS